LRAAGSQNIEISIVFGVSEIGSASTSRLVMAPRRFKFTLRSASLASFSSSSSMCASASRVHACGNPGLNLMASSNALRAL
jgi:hypothetical protein